jgi:hypothetical protein
MSLLKSVKYTRTNTPPPPLIPKGQTQSISDVLKVTNQNQKPCNSNDPIVLKPIVKVLTFSDRPQRYEVILIHNIEM